MSTLVELCAGSAALTRRLLGLGKLVGYMGSKDRYTEQIIQTWGVPKPRHVVLNDPGMWGDVWESYSLKVFGAVSDLIGAWSCRDARTLFDNLRAASDQNDVIWNAAANLCLFAATYGGGEIGGFKGKHKLRPSVDGYIPSRRSLAKRVREFRYHQEITASSVCATKIEPVPGSWVYIDPPYAGSSGYINQLGRDQVLTIARRWRAAGCQVAISEAVPLDGELGAGWKSVNLATTSGQCRKNSKQKCEYLTYAI